MLDVFTVVDWVEVKVIVGNKSRSTTPDSAISPPVTLLMALGSVVSLKLIVCPQCLLSSN